MSESISEVVTRIGCEKDKLLEILLALQSQSKHNYLSKETIEEVSDILDISVTTIYGIAEFYDILSTEKRGEYVIQICNSTPCYLKEANHLVKIFEDILGIKMGDTTPDGIFSLEFTSCIGACDLAPAVRINNEIYGELDRSKVFNLLAKLKGGEING
ncbi:MAG: NAD(P)H-dependent oxidoreductase subunit E [Firmicutes bacterium]|jgi:NADH-quinone oxidoreductase subunit E|nr:NAD(P)H-dependent oxidoreductase subunit E [Bacillota bacterium]